jgi:hypothetical protein
MYIPKTVLGMACSLGLILTAPALGNSVTFEFTVNTSSASGTTGYIDFGLDPGTLGALGVTASIGGFSGGTLSTNTTTPGTTNGTNLYYIDGQVTTTPLSSPVLLSPSNTLTMMNGDANNELTQALTFGASSTFFLTLSGPGVGGGSGPSGTTFVLDFLNDAQTAYLFSSDPTGSTSSLWATDLINISNTGVVTVVENPGPGGGPTDGVVTASPEPGSMLMPTTGMLLILGLGLSKRRSCRAAWRVIS